MYCNAKLSADNTGCNRPSKLRSSEDGDCKMRNCEYRLQTGLRDHSEVLTFSTALTTSRSRLLASLAFESDAGAAAAAFPNM